ncbi:pitrilysin family protein [Elizabethkingia sp. HX QKY]|uniref:M16 family metallopeptidase n=1 Tax=Elizabethkingia TaxID=308865 RepID=UPI002A2429DD|nr:pitrilysin family protein [Elizabethkingia sp. HX QKY]MDX8571852.1 pitrilysin family protein [Elizabethkingia sp. HX QKY]
MKKQIIHLTIAFLLSGVLSAQKINLGAMPKPGPTPIVNIAKPKIFQLSNGLTVVIVEDNKLPKVNANLLVQLSPYYEGALTGIRDVMAEQFNKGTANSSKEEFNKKIDFLGASLSFSSKGASAASLSKYFPEVLGLMADAIINPKFSKEEIQNSKNRMLENLKSEGKNTSVILSRVSNALQYGESTSRGQFATAESVNKIQLTDVQQLYEKYYAPDQSYLVIVGDVKYKQVKTLVEKSFNNWKKINFVVKDLEPASNMVKTEINIVDVPTAVQSVIAVNNLITLKMKDRDYFPAVIANQILGGEFSSRLNMNLREKNGFTYGAKSLLNVDKYYPVFSAQASVRNEVTDKAVKEIMNELKAIATVTPEELENTKALLKGKFIRSLENPKTIAILALEQKLMDLPSDFYTNYLKSIDKVTTADISNVIKDIILPDQSRIFVVGKASDVSTRLEKLGYPVKYFDKEANPVKK